MGFNANEIYPSNSDHLKAEDIGTTMPTYSISGVDLKKFDNGDQKLILSFHELEKSLVLNKTNSDAISDLYSPDTDQWFGKQIMLFTMPVEFQGKKTQGLRVRGPARTDAQANAADQANAPAYSELNPPPHTG